MRLLGVTTCLGLAPLLAACGDAAYPWEVPDAGAGPVPQSSASAPASSEADDLGLDKPRFEGGLFVRCAAELRASDDPVRDVTRLGLSCGPSTGMSRVGDGPHEGAVAEGAADVRLPMSFAAGRCYRLFAVGGPGIEDLSVEVRSSHGTLVASDHGDDRIAIVQPDRAVCPPAADEVLVVVAAKKGRGAFALELWEVSAH